MAAMAVNTLDKDTFQLVRNMKIEAQEKAFEIEVMGINDFENEKDGIVGESISNINREFQKKKDNYNMEKKIERSTKINTLRLQKMGQRNILMEKLIVDTKKVLKEKICIPDNKRYKEMMKNILIQGMIKLMENKVKLIVREGDKKMVSGMFKECEKEYVEIMKRETGRDYSTTLSFYEGKVLDQADQLCGGVMLTSEDGKIVCLNTIENRLLLAYEELLPQVRALLFP